MVRARLVLAILAAALVFSGGLFGDDTKKEGKSRGTLPTKWSKIGLSDEQKNKIYSVQSSYRAKVQELESKIKELRAQEKAELEAVLTDSQKTRLRELLLEKAPAQPGTSATKTAKDK